MIFLNDDHAEKWADAVQRTGSLMEDDNVKGDFAASLFIITGDHAARWEGVPARSHPRKQ